MAEFDKVKYVKQYCFSILPQVYCDRFSITEQIGQIVEALNKLIVNNNNIEDYIKEEINNIINNGEIVEILKELISNYVINIKFPPNGITPAAGDGITDDTTTIQSCIDYAYEDGGKCVIIPEGVYLNSGLTLKDGVSLVGLSKFKSILMLKPNSNKPIITSNASQIQITNLTFDENIEFQSNNPTIILNGNYCDISSIILKNNYIGLQISSDNSYVTINDVIIDYVKNKGVVFNGNSIYNVNMITITNIINNGAVTAFEINTSNSTYNNILSKSVTEKGLVINGSNNAINGNVLNANITLTESGENNVNLSSTIKKEKYVNVNSDISNINVKTNTLNVEGTATTDIKFNEASIEIEELTETINTKNSVINTINETGTTKTENFTTKNLNVDNINIKETAEIKYKKPTKYNSLFNYIDIKDQDNEDVKILVASDSLDLLQLTKNNSWANAELKARLINESGNFYGSENRNYYSWSQGGCITPFNSYIVALAPDKKVSENMVRLQEIDMTTLNVVKSKDLLLFHCNSITIDPVQRVLYTVDLTDELIPGSWLLTLTKINYDTFEIINRITLSGIPNIVGVSCYDGELYVESTQFIYKVNADNTCTQLFSFEELSTLQGFTVDDKYFYIVGSAPNMMYLYDKFTYNVVMIYNLGEFTNGQTYGELEDVSTYNNEVFLNCSYNLSSGSKFNATDIIKLNLNKNVHALKYFKNNMSPIAIATLYCDCTRTANYSDGSSSYPFKTVGEALTYAKANGNMENVIINLVNAGDYGTANIQGFTNVSIYNNSSGEVFIDGIWIRGGSHYFSGITFRCQWTTLTYVMLAESAKIGLLNCNFPVYGISTYACSLTRCQLDISAGTYGSFSDIPLKCYNYTTIKITSSPTFTGQFLAELNSGSTFDYQYSNNLPIAKLTSNYSKYGGNRYFIMPYSEKWYGDLSLDADRSYALSTSLFTFVNIEIAYRGEVDYKLINLGYSSYTYNNSFYNTTTNKVEYVSITLNLDKTNHIITISSNKKIIDGVATNKTDNTADVSYPSVRQVFMS